MMQTTSQSLKKSKKVLSQAAIKRLEKERQEAAKSKVEKLAESIKNRSTIAAKHSSVVNTITTIKKRNTLVKKYKLNPINKVKQQAPMPRETNYANFEARIAERNKQQHHLLKQADNIRNRLAKLSNRENIKTIEGLRDCYGIYEIIESSKDGDLFYDILRSFFKATLVPIQSNTPNESLLVRFIFSQKSTKQVSEYATVLRYAREINISKNNFIKWYSETTQTRILNMARKQVHTCYEDKLKRARILLLRYFDIQEQWPLGHFEYPAVLAQKKVHLPDDLIFIVARGVRQFDRGSHIANISALYFIPPNIDLSNDIMNRITAHIVPALDMLEKELEEKTEEVWANDLTHYLMERELGAAYKSADKWADRTQASIAIDQVQFEKQRKKIQKLRDENRKQ